MKTVTEHIRERLERCLQPPTRKPSLEDLRRIQWSNEFEQLMRNRLVMGGIRYETFGDKRANPRGTNYDYVGSVQYRLEEYKKTGNAECLVDAANCLMLEFEFGNHPTKHFHSVDDGVHVNFKD